MSDKVKMVKVVALHDLSYLDHERKPQYRRQSSLPFDLDEGNVNQFLARKAVKLFEAPAASKPAEHDLPDEFGEEAETNMVEDFGDEAEANPAPTHFGKRKKR